MRLENKYCKSIVLNAIPWDGVFRTEKNYRIQCKDCFLITILITKAQLIFYIQLQENQD